MSLAECCVARGSDSLAPRGIQNNENSSQRARPQSYETFLLRVLVDIVSNASSSNIVAASANRKPCFRKLVAAFSGIPLKFHNRNIRAYLYTQLVLRSSGPAVGTLVGDLPHQYGAAAVRRRESMTSLRTEMAAGGPLGGLRENTAAVAIFRSVRSREISEKYML